MAACLYADGEPSRSTVISDILKVGSCPQMVSLEGHAGNAQATNLPH